ncbi:MAG: tRNA (N6-threonylcarbamoyladenosine(37)-N6)-methyltransferase TrmO [Phycisphaerae bacterium]
MEFKPIGIIHSPFKTAQGTPIQAGLAKESQGIVEIFPEYADGLKDIEGFDRIWLLFWIDKAAPAKLLVKPYLDTVQRGVFATRAPSRPNPIGLSCVKLLRRDGCHLYIAELDILDQTPLLDIKPYITKADVFKVKHCGWLDKVWDENTKADNRFYEDKEK